MQRVAITGMGIVSSLGSTLPAVTDSLRIGRSGVGLSPTRQEMGFNGCLTGVLAGYEPPSLSKRYLRQIGEGGLMALAASRRAIEDATLEDAAIADERTGIIVGNSGNMRDVFQNCHAFAIEKKKLSAMALPRTMASSVSANLSVVLKTRGYCMTLACACASGAAAIGQAAHLVRFGFQDRMLAGGVQEGSWEYDCNFDALRVFSGRHADPAAASRPFDKSRDGLVPSLGAGIVVLENWEQAKARGARIYAELIGYASNSDGCDMTTASGVGAERCMNLALEDAGIDAGQVNYVNAHATSTPTGDVIEAQAIARVFGRNPKVSSTKSMTGHEIGAAGSNELIYTLLMMEHGFVAPSINIVEIDDGCREIDIVANQLLATPIDVAVSNSFGFGGVNSVLIVRRACVS